MGKHLAEFLSGGTAPCDGYKLNIWVPCQEARQFNSGVTGDI